MNCTSFETNLAALLDGERRTDTATANELLAHARECADCRGAIHLVRLASVPAARRDPIPDPGDDYWGSLEARISAELAAAPHPPRRWLRPALWAVAALVALALILVPWLSGNLTPTGVDPELREAVDAVFDRAMEGDIAPGGAFGPADQGPLPDLESLTDEQKENLTRWLEELGRPGGGQA